MCGFTTYQGNKKDLLPFLKKSYEALKHRGNDEHHFYIKDNIGLQHNRLVLNGEIGNGSQPFIEDDLYCVVNGEFYNYKQIAKDHNFILKSKSDSELLIHLYRKYGTNCLTLLDGEFAFSLYDKKENLWFCARDRFGVRPLHYYINEQEFITSSEAKGIFPFLDDVDIDLNSLSFSQRFQYLPIGKTLFKNINIIPPANFLIYKNNKITLNEYWSPIQPKINEYSEETLELLLKNAVDKRVKDLNVKACVHLSGGLDSSTIAYYSNLKDAYTISFKDGGVYDELNLAKITASKLGLNLNVVEVSKEDILDNFEKSIFYSEGLTINGHFTAKYLLSQKIHNDGFKIALTGEGSDEIFMGYSHLKQDYFGKVSNFENKYLQGYQLDDGKGIIQPPLDFTWLKAKSNMAYKMSKFWTDDFKQLALSHDQEMLNSNNSKISKLKQSSLLWQKYCLSGYILKTLDDGLGMANAVESRLAFLDHKLVEYVFNLPDECYFGDMEKILLRKLMKNKLPNEIIYKTKQSFMSPPIIEMDKLLTNDFIQNTKDIFKHNEMKNLTLTEPEFMTLLSIASIYRNFKK